ncbi:MAG: hypothetical protein KDI74_04940 [Gammaproteobacteria bacterium]|nr:hypothetical protein [Gammaproteobacteria bacterium]
MKPPYSPTLESTIKLAEQGDIVAAKFLLKQAARHLNNRLVMPEPLSSYIAKRLLEISKSKSTIFHLKKPNHREANQRRDWEISVRYQARLKKEGERYSKKIKEELADEYGVTSNRIGKIVKLDEECARYVDSLEEAWGCSIDDNIFKPRYKKCKK